MSDHELDTCECGDYRRDHIDGHGACRHNKPMDLTHGYRDRTAFRLAHRHGEMTGFLSTLSESERKAALSFEGPDLLGDPEQCK